MPEKLLDRHVFVFNPRDNGGEQLMLVTEIYDNGDAAVVGLPGGIYTYQNLSLQSYCNSASIALGGANMTPENLRQLANELDEALARARAGVKNPCREVSLPERDHIPR